MKKNRLISLLLCLAVLLPMLCTGVAAGDYSVSGAEKNYLKAGDYFSIYPSSPEYTTYALTAQRNAFNAVGLGDDVQLWSIGTGKWCVQRMNGDGVMAIMYVENREDHKKGDKGDSPKFWALDGNHTSSGTQVHMWEDDNVNDKEKTFYLEDDHDGDPETYYICSAHAYNKKGARYVVPESTDFHNGTRAKLGSKGYSWRISIVSRATDANDNIDWMSQMDGSTLLSNVNIPGTHDSATANVNAVYAENANNYTCQMHFIDEQLNCGVRAFDIRYCKHGDDVYTCHGGGDYRCATPKYDGSHDMSVDWVMGKMTAFLEEKEGNKSQNETIIMVIKQDDGNKDAPKVMADTLLKYKNYLYDWSSSSPTLDQVRGKIVVMSRSDFSGLVDDADLKYFGPNISNWDDAYEDNDHWAQKIGKSGDPVEVYIQDDYNCTDYNKMVQVENVIKQLNGKTDFKEVDSDDVNSIPDIPETAFCFNYSSKAYSDDPNPLGAARVINSWLYTDAKNYFANGGWRTGITMTDYCDEILCDLIIASNAGRKSQTHTCAFNDVAESDWFHEIVEKAAELGLMNGVGDMQFNPEGTMRSAMAVQILYNREGRPEVQIEDGIDSDAWYAPAVSWGLQQGIIGDGFSPEEALPRQDIILIIYNYAKLTGLDTSTVDDLTGFVDVDRVAPELMKPVGWAVGNGIIDGNNLKQIQPEEGITRAEAAKVFVNFTQFAK